MTNFNYRLKKPIVKINQKIVQFVDDTIKIKTGVEQPVIAIGIDKHCNYHYDISYDMSPGISVFEGRIFDRCREFILCDLWMNMGDGGIIIDFSDDIIPDRHIIFKDMTFVSYETSLRGVDVRFEGPAVKRNK